MANHLDTPISAPDSNLEWRPDEELVRGFLLALGAGGRKQRTLQIYEDSIRRLSDFAGSQGLPGLATMDRTHIRHWLTTPHQKGNKPATVSVRYRSLAGSSVGVLRRENVRTIPWTRSTRPRSPTPSKRITCPTTSKSWLML